MTAAPTSDPTSPATRAPAVLRHYANDPQPIDPSPGWRSLPVRAVLARVAIFLAVLLGGGALVTGATRDSAPDLRAELQRHEVLREDITRGNYPREALSRFPPPDGRPRVVIFGNSQIRGVKRLEAAGIETESLADDGRALRARLQALVPEVEVLDVSADGQKAIEMLAMMPLVERELSPRVVVLPLSLALMPPATTLRPGVREAMEPADLEHVRQLAQREGFDALSDVFDVLVAKEGVYTGGDGDSYFAEPVERWLGRAVGLVYPLYRRSDALRNAARNEFVKRLKSLINRMLGRTTAKTFGISEGFLPGLQALEAIALDAGSRGVSVVLYEQPIHPSADPPQFTPAALERYRAEIAALERRAPVLHTDLSNLLDESHFGTYPDGSPDRIHHDARGHQQVAQELAPLIRRALNEPEASRALQ